MKRTFATMCGTGPRVHELTVSKPLYKYCQETGPDGVITLTNFFGIGFWFVDSAPDECIAAWNNGEYWSGAARHCINYTTAGRPYIRKGAGRYYLDEAMRTA